MGKAIMHALSAALTVVDYVSDIMLGFEYLTSNNPVWGGLTLAFIAGPAISAIYIGAYVCPEEDKNKFGEKLFYIWKGSEVCLESGPQVILQLYILALSDLDRSTVSGSDLRLTIMQTATVISSLLTLCQGFAAWRNLWEEAAGNTDWSMGIDMLWNVLSVSPRVIALALFASYQPFWFWALVIVQIVIVTVVFIVSVIRNDKIEGTRDILISLGFGLFNGIGTIFNMFAVVTIPFSVYLYYWLVVFTENSAMILLWYIWSSDRELWYHDVALGFVSVSYVVSLVIEFLQCRWYPFNSAIRDPIKWTFFKGDGFLTERFAVE